MGNRTRLLTLLALATLPWLPAIATSLRAEVGKDAQPSSDFAEVLDPDRQQGYVVRAESWGGTLPSGQTKAIQHQLIKGNEYRFYLGTDVSAAKVSVNVYDADGNLAGENNWQKAGEFLSFAGTTIRPKRTGSYYLIVKVESSPQPTAAWSMVYAFK